MSTPARAALDGDLAQIATWTSACLLTPPNLHARLDELIESSSASASEHKQTFAKLAGDASASRLTPDRWASYLQSTGILPDSPLGRETAMIVYQSLSYLSRAPFHETTKAEPDTAGLTFNELYRAVAWALPDRHRSFLEESDQSRMRSAADHRRLIFQSLATSAAGAKVPYNADAVRELAVQNAGEGVDPMFEELVVVNHDGDGDEMFHDVLDVLYSAQPQQHPGAARVHRDSFRNVAKELHGDGVRLHDLAVPYERFKVLTKALLLGQFEVDGKDGQSQSESAELDEAAEAGARAFCRDVDVGVTWVEFDRAMKKIAPHLFDAFYHIIALATTGTPCPGLPYRSPPPKPAKNSIITLSMHAQLNTFLSGLLDFDEMSIVHNIDPSSTAPSQSDPPLPLPSLSASTSTTLLIISGLDPNGTRYTFGAYRDANVAAQSRSRSGVFSSVSTKKNPDDTLLFQLRPQQDVFLGVGTPAWTASAAETCFGTHMKGAVMVLRDGARNCIFTNNDHGPDGEVYAPMRWRGAWSVEFRVDKLEMWRGVSDGE